MLIFTDDHLPVKCTEGERDKMKQILCSDRALKLVCFVFPMQTKVEKVCNIHLQPPHLPVGIFLEFLSLNFSAGKCDC